MANREIQNDKTINLTTFFDCSLNSSLQNIALNVVKLFFYLNQNTLDLRMVAKLFARGATKYKTMLRKLYTVAAGLELSQIIGKTNKVAEIKFLHNLNDNSPNLLDIMSMLNTNNNSTSDEEYRRRRSEFNDLTLDKRYIITGIPIEPQIITEVF